MSGKKWNPGSLLELSGYYWKICTLHAAVKLDVFTRIGDETITGETLAEKAGADADAMTRLANALVSMELLCKKNGGYANMEEPRQYLCRQSPDYIGYMILHHHYLVAPWARLDESVRTGRPAQEGASSGDEQAEESEREAFLMGMFSNSRLIAPQLAPHVPLEGRRRLLDMGGGPGTYAIFFCSQHPALSATVFDLPETRPFAEKTIERFGMSSRIDFAEGNYLEEELPRPCDVVYMSHILHGEGYGDCVRMIEKARRALEKGGLVVIHDFILEENRTEPIFPALFSLNMLVATEHGRTYTESEIKEMMKAAGLKNILRLPYSGPNGAGLMMAEKA